MVTSEVSAIAAVLATVRAVPARRAESHFVFVMDSLPNVLEFIDAPDPCNRLPEGEY
jgi:hypothetical protein